MKQPISKLKEWFGAFKMPTANQFADWIDSYWHKDGKIPAANIEGWTDDSAVEIEGNELPELANKNKYIQVLGGPTGRTLTYKGIPYPITKDCLAIMFWSGTVKTWNKQQEDPLPKGANGKTAEAYNPAKTGGYSIGDMIIEGSTFFECLAPLAMGQAPSANLTKVKVIYRDGLGQINSTEMRSVSGAKIQEQVFEGLKVEDLTNWSSGYYLTTGAEASSADFSRMKITLLKGQALRAGLNTYTGGGTAAILNVYNIDGSFNRNEYRHSLVPNQFFTLLFIATADCQVGIAEYNKGNFGVRYARIETYSENNLNVHNTKIIANTTGIDVINNGVTSIYPAHSVNIETAGYWLVTGATATGVGHKRTTPFLLHKGQIFDYGINVFTSVGSVACLLAFNLDGSFKEVIMRPTTATLGKFVEGSYTSKDEVLIGGSDYFEGGYGVAYINVREAIPVNYKKGINYLLDQDIIKVSPSDFEAYRIFQRGAARQNVQTVRKIGVIEAGQSHIRGVLDLSTLPLPISGNDNTVPFSMMWNHGARLFGPWKFGVNTGEGPLTSTLNLYGFDCLAIYKWGQYLNKTIYVIKNARGGTAIDLAGSNGGGYWTAYTENIPSGSLKMLEDLKFKVYSALQANPDLDIKAVIWHQGEGDATPQAEGKYYQNFKNVISYIRGIANNPKLLFICGTITPVSSQYSQKVHDAQVRIAQEDQFVRLIDMSDGTVFDGVHFDPASTELFADRVFNELKTIV